MQKCKEELRDEKTALICSVQVTPEPIIFLSTEQQLKDIERFCTNPEMFCVLGIDATFELCDYYMTFVTYHNHWKRWEIKYDKCPVMDFQQCCTFEMRSSHEGQYLE